MKAVQWIFLIYVSRSGSTLLSRQIASNTDEILVLPELKVVEEIVCFGVEKFFAMPGKQQICLIKRDPRWTNLDVGDDDLALALAAADGLEGFMQQLVAIVAQQKKLSPRYVVIKNGGSLWVHKKICQQFPTASFLHIVRDARGCIASRMQSIRVYHEKPDPRMSDPWYLAQIWRRYINNARALAEQGIRVIEIQYEQLLLDSTQSLTQLFSLLEVEFKPTSGNSFNLNEKERSAKHANVERPVMAERIRAWETELGLENGIVVEYLLKDHLQDSYFLPNAGRLRLVWAIFIAFFRHWYINGLKLVHKIARR